MARYGNRTKTVSATTSAGLEVKVRLTLGAGGDVTVHYPKGDGGWMKGMWFSQHSQARLAFPGVFRPALAQALADVLSTLLDQRREHFDALRAEREKASA